MFFTIHPPPDMLVWLCTRSVSSAERTHTVLMKAIAKQGVTCNLQTLQLTLHTAHNFSDGTSEESSSGEKEVSFSSRSVLDSHVSLTC